MIGNQGFAQAGLFLQIEEINSTEVIKIPVGSVIVFKAPKYSSQWQKGLIKEINYDGNTLIFDHTFMTLDEIEKIKTRSFTGETIGWMLQAFGFGWLGFGALADLAGAGPETNLNRTNIFIGASAIGSGWLIRKTSGNKVYTDGKTHRFRLLDTRFSVEKE